MKRCLCLLCALAILLMPMALAAEGDAILAHNDRRYIRNIFVDGDTLYLQEGNGVMTYHIGDADVREYEWDYESLPKTEDDESFSDGFLFAGDGELWSIDFVMRYDRSASRFERALLSQVELTDEGKAVRTETRELDWPYELVERYGEYEDPSNFENVIYRDGVLYCLTGRRQAYRLSLDDMKPEPIGDEGVSSLLPYTDGQIVMVKYDYSAGKVVLTGLDPVSGDETPIGEWDLQSAAGIAADPKSGAIYCLDNGTIKALDPGSGQLGERLADLPMSVNNEQNGWIMGGQYYVCNCNGGVVVRNLKPDKLPEHSIRIVDTSWNDSLTDAYINFSNAHGDVSVAISRDYRVYQHLLEDMMNRNADVDIYLLDLSSAEYDALKNRGFLAEMESEKLNGLLENVYPDVRSRLTNNGRIVALPTQCNLWAVSISEAALKRLDLSLEDVPTNWMDFLDFLIEDLPERFAKDSGVRLFYEGITVSSARQQLFGQIFTDYQNYASTTMDVPSFDTELLRALLEKLNRVDFLALGVDPDPEDSGMSGGYTVFSSGMDDSVLMSVGGSASFGDYYTDMQPILMAMDADSPAIMPLNVSAAIINPFSENRELAEAFLEVLADKSPRTLMYNLDPALNEPIRRDDGEEMIKYAKEYVADVETRMKNAEEADHQALEEELKQAREWLERSEEQSWLVSRKQIDWYRANDDHVICQGTNWLYQDSTGEAYELMRQYLDGQIDAGQFLKGVDKKVRMMMMEGN